MKAATVVVVTGARSCSAQEQWVLAGRGGVVVVGSHLRLRWARTIDLLVGRNVCHQSLGGGGTGPWRWRAVGAHLSFAAC